MLHDLFGFGIPCCLVLFWLVSFHKVARWLIYHIRGCWIWIRITVGKEAGIRVYKVRFGVVNMNQDTENEKVLLRDIS